MGLLIAGAIIILWSFSRFARKPHAKTRNFIVFGIGATLWLFGIHAQAGIPGVLISIIGLAVIGVNRLFRSPIN